MSKVDNKLRPKVYVKLTDRQSYLHSKSEHSNTTKKSIAYNEALWFNRIYYNRSDLLNNCKRLLNTLTKTDYNKADTTTQIDDAISVPRNELLNKIKKSNNERLPLAVTYNRTLPGLKTIIDKNGNNVFLYTFIYILNQWKNTTSVIG